MKKTICNICPRNCNINRNEKAGYCGAKTLKIAKIMKHFWEEPIISGTNGSGAIFFSYCNLKCLYCQNYELSHGGLGRELTIKELADIFKELEQSGAHNINLVTPTHYTDEIIEALKIYRPNIPIVWNTSGYESVDTIKKLKDYVDVYLCDFKYADNKLAADYSKAPNYVESVTSALLEMRKNEPKDIIDNGIMKKGIIVRHMVLPTHSNDSVKVLEWVKEHLGADTIVSLMSQYTPCYKAKEHPILKNRVSPLEYKRVVQKCIALGLENGYLQEATSASCEYIPDFGVFKDLK
ncbi:MAG: radical SAM protein [Spirochaetales bacterium]